MGWSPDGRRLAFSRTPPGGGPDSARVWIADADGANLQAITSGAAHNPSWSPDSRWLSYDVDPDGYIPLTDRIDPTNPFPQTGGPAPTEIHIVTVNSTDDRVVYRPNANTNAHWAVFSPVPTT